MRRPLSEADSESGQCYDTTVSRESDKNLLNFIATTVEALRERIDTISDQMATKVDLANLRDQMATLSDQMATKEELAALRAEMATEFAAVRAEMATKEELAALRAEMATKDDLRRLEVTMDGKFEQVYLRLDSIERGVGSRMGQIESEVSRLRSVVYLLVKDQPGMLRLLGPPAPRENRPRG
jgi:hypothetical protein